MMLRVALTSAAVLFLLVLTPAGGASEVHMANGIKIGEVDQQSAIVWTRLTEQAERNTDGRKFKKNDGEPGRGLTDLDAYRGSVPGTEGEVRVRYWVKGEPEQSTATEWQGVDPQRDFTRQFRLEDLRPGTRYELKVEGRADSSDESPVVLEGGFRTAPAADTAAEIQFVVVTCGDYPRRDDAKRGHKIYPVMQQLDPDFFVHAGDVEYYDKPLPYATTAASARFKWNRIFAMPFQREFHNHVGSYFMKDDHDTLKNDCWPGQTYGDLTWDEGLAIFREQVPMGEKTYRTIRWGQDLQIWMIEGRDFRSPNDAPDGPDKTILGEEQKRWLKESFAASDATFRILISPTPLVGPDKGSKGDNHANDNFAHEGQELREFFSQQKNAYIICGDRHWQYVSVDAETGIREYACGPSSDSHDQGKRHIQPENPEDIEMHHYYRHLGGFLCVEIDRHDGAPQIVFRHHGVDGRVHHKDVFTTSDATSAEQRYPRRSR